MSAAATRQHTIRLPAPLFDRVQVRALSMRRSINHEIALLIEAAFDAQEAADLDAANASPGP